MEAPHTFERLVCTETIICTSIDAMSEMEYYELSRKIAAQRTWTLKVQSMLAWTTSKKINQRDLNVRLIMA
jgi:hypothetical protein